MDKFNGKIHRANQPKRHIGGGGGNRRPGGRVLFGKHVCACVGGGAGVGEQEIEH